MTSVSSGSRCGSCCGADVRDTAPAQEPLQDGVRFYIPAMDCPTEERLIRARLEPMPEVRGLAFNLLERTLEVQPADQDSLEKIVEALKEIGFAPQARGNQPAQEAPADQGFFEGYGRLLAGGFFALLAEVLDLLALEPEWLVLLAALVAIGLSGLATYRKGWQALRQRDFNINALMSIAVTGAVLIGEWPEAAMVMVLFTLSEVIEAKTLDRARDAIRKLMALAPDTARVQDATGDWVMRPVSEVTVGQIVRVRPGEKIPLDGEIISGSAAINQAPVTGESLPVEKAAGDKVFAGTLNETGLLEIEVTATAGDSTIARIIHAVEKAQSERAPVQRFVDQFARIYTPVVLVVAVLTAVLMPLVFGWNWLDAVYRALVLLVIACPCALVISTPVTVVSSLAVAARHGVLVKGGRYLEQAGKLRCIAFDKTGTLTEGRPDVVHAEWLAQNEKSAMLLCAASLAKESDHPVSQAVVRFAEDQNQLTRKLPVTGFESLTGRGIRGVVDGIEYVLGNHRLIQELGSCSAELKSVLQAVEKQGQTAVTLLCDKKPVVVFAVADRPRPHSRTALEQLRGLGVHSVVLSGDNPHTVASVAQQIGLDDARGDLLPDQKLKAIAELKAEYGITGMAGDGINDAPAMAAADISFAMGAAGTDTAIETADVALMDDNLEKLPWLIRLSRLAKRRLRQNITIALGVKVLFMALALMGQASLWMAVFADVGASLLVIFNGLRILRFGPITGTGQVGSVQEIFPRSDDELS